MTSRRTPFRLQRAPAFSLLLGSIVSGVGVACDSDGGQADPDGLGGAPPGTYELCEGARTLLDGLRPEIELDSLSFYVGETEHLCTPPDYELGAVIGTPCASADDQEACEEEIERLRAGSVDWGHYDDFWSASFGLLVATGSKEAIAELGGPVQELPGDVCGSWQRGGPRLNTDADDEESGGMDAGLGGAGGAGAPSRAHVTTIAERETLLKLLGVLDTPEEAALVLWANDFTAPCTVEKLSDGTYQVMTTEEISDCPVTEQDYRVQVTAAGVVTATPVGSPRESDVCVGRRPHGLAAGVPCAADQLGFEAAWLADVARLETAAVVAFAQMAATLERLGAPDELAARARTAALDEMRHARGVQALATRRGAPAKAAVVSVGKEHDVLSLAVENAIEGCVRECWGALLAHYQARAAQDASVRELWRQIADEESSHALLSMDIGAWLSSRLTPAERDVVEAARQRAMADLFVELAGDEPASPALGLPDRATRLALLRALEARVLRPLAA